METPSIPSSVGQTRRIPSAKASSRLRHRPASMHLTTQYQTPIPASGSVSSTSSSQSDCAGSFFFSHPNTPFCLSPESTPPSSQPASSDESVARHQRKRSTAIAKAIDSTLALIPAPLFSPASSRGYLCFPRVNSEETGSPRRSSRLEPTMNATRCRERLEQLKGRGRAREQTDEREGAGLKSAEMIEQLLAEMTHDDDGGGLNEYLSEEDGYEMKMKMGPDDQAAPDDLDFASELAIVIGTEASDLHQGGGLGRGHMPFRALSPFRPLNSTDLAIASDPVSASVSDDTDFEDDCPFLAEAKASKLCRPANGSQALFGERGQEPKDIHQVEGTQQARKLVKTGTTRDGVQEAAEVEIDINMETGNLTVEWSSF